MAKSSYQTYTSETSIFAFRADFIHREAMCAAIAKRHPELAPIAAEAREIVAAIDGKKAGLEEAEDDLIRARALEAAEKLETVDAYAKLRGVVGTYDPEHLPAFLPDAPSSLEKLGAKNLRGRVAGAIESLKKLPDGEGRYAELIAALEEGAAELATADHAEDAARAQLKATRLALLVYRGELAAARDGQLGSIQAIVKERARVAAFTLPWRKRSAAEGEEADERDPAAKPVLA